MLCRVAAALSATHVGSLRPLTTPDRRAGGPCLPVPKAPMLEVSLAHVKAEAREVKVKLEFLSHEGACSSQERRTVEVSLAVAPKP